VRACASMAGWEQEPEGDIVPRFGFGAIQCRFSILSAIWPNAVEDRRGHASNVARLGTLRKWVLGDVDDVMRHEVR